ncbi:MAG TPA: hypothetical protein DDY58_16650 [Terrisporobacter glycolicus]|uniref:Uncharacterized protein n=2 Tax=Terrisporobacter TaxID=1505652 RepID=A0AAX2ZNV5_9FIRM|nr:MULTISPECIES: hypothetical protein [Terrisporobacter]MBN9647940.1 hypothetical protein [Terrisporobacter glycolicus]UEL49312.1 hypothetical protein JW646_07675 [Terrisporobacter hibernicus]HBI93915.1 hypothetical protein [Terrisporobacter hibernicus]
MKKNKSINFLKEEKQEEKIFKCTVIILIYLLIFQTYTNIKAVNNLKEEINYTKLMTQSNEVLKSENKKSTLIKDTNKIYDLLGFSNVEKLSVENNKVSIEGKCKNLKKLDELKSMDNIKNFSIASVENKNNKLYFHAVYEIGGSE